MKQYTVKQVSEALGVNPRAVQKRCVRANLDMTKGVYLIPENIFEKWIAKKERTSNMTIVRPSTLEKENFRRNSQLNTPDYASITKRPKQDNEETENLRNEIESLRSDLLSHNKLFRAMYERLKSLETNDFDDVAETIKEKLPEPPLQVYKTQKTPRELYNSIHPPNTTEKTKDGKEIPKPSMNDVNFQSSYDPNWNKDNE